MSLGAGAGFDHHLEARIDELADHVGHERDTALSGLHLFWNADLHATAAERRLRGAPGRCTLSKACENEHLAG